ncbi:BTAD domain-containing putative transcriptional regulator [Kitasatospora sp. NPDC056138]|uniref:AfsR/SARP family transcriptional regulator n=1 Tax=Kitasatospora sp. NPDC056138 TaxID=3345724 RepID=UPI0035DC21F5
MTGTGERRQVDGLKVEVLGPLRAWRAGSELDTGSAQQRAVLAALALRSGRVVSVEELSQGIWGWNPPASSAVALRNHISRLRGALETEPRAPRLLVSVAGGYTLRLDEDALDAARAERLAAEAEHAARTGDRPEAARLLDQALALWAGVPLTGVPGEYAERQRERLAERRLALLETWLGLELELGRHARAVAELTALADEHPMREGLRALQMLALYRSGRQADALAAYDRTRRTLTEELGLDPGPELVRLHQRVLRTDPELAAPGAEPSAPAAPSVTAWLPPAQLPLDVPDFTGRTETIAELDEALARPAHGIGTAAAVCVVHGMGGVGKTTLAVHAAHRSRGSFPEGQLYADLRGASAKPADPYLVQGLFLRALGVPSENIPTSPPERTALYRTRLAGRRLLILLDNAADTEQVEPLLPGTAECAVLVTSRASLTCLPVTSRTALEPFTEREALDLLRRITGTARLTREPEAARALVRTCGLLPLAVRIAASRLAARPRWTVASLTDRLANRPRRLSELETGSLAVDAAFQLGYAALDPAQAWAFRLLAIPETPDLSPGTAAAVLDCSDVEAEEVLESLADAGLLEPGDPGRYRYHDLVRLFARHRTLEADPPQERQAALSRLARCHLAGTSAALRSERPYTRLAGALNPGLADGPQFTSPAEAQRWVIEELAGMIGLATQILQHPTRPAGLDDARVITATLTAMVPFTDLCMPWRLVLPIGQALLRIAEQAASPEVAVNAGVVLAVAYAHTGNHAEAREAALRAWRTGEHRNDGVFPHRLRYTMGAVAALDPASVDEAVVHFEQARTLAHEAGETSFEAQCALGLAQAHLSRNDHAEALKEGQAALAHFRATACHLPTTLALRALGLALHGLGRHDDAVARYGEALALCDTHGLRSQHAATLLACAVAHLDAGRPTEADALAGRAVGLFADIGDLAGQQRAQDVVRRARSMSL